MLGELKLEGNRLRLAVSNNEIGEVHGNAVGQEIVRRCNEYPALVASRVSDLEAKVWAEFASAAIVGDLASEDIRNENNGGRGTGMRLGDPATGTTREQEIAGAAGRIADAMLQEWRQRFGAKS